MDSSSRHRDFAVAAEVREKAPVTFTLEGFEFECLPEAPAAVLTDFISDVSGQVVSKSSAALVAFVESVLVDEDVAKFRELVRSKEVIIPIEVLGDVVMWLVEEYSGRPFVRPSRSAGGRATPRDTSTDDSASVASLPSATSRSAAR